MSKGILKEGVLGVLKIQWNSMFKNYRKHVDATHTKKSTLRTDDMATERK